MPPPINPQSLLNQPYDPGIWITLHTLSDLTAAETALIESTLAPAP